MILCCGEALIDMLLRQSTNGEDCFAPLAGGSVMNTAVALGRLGANVQFFSGLSNDLFGEILKDHLASSKVDTSPVHWSDDPTTLAFVKLVDGHASYAFYDENTAGRLLSVDDLPEVTADALFFGGISLVVEPCATAYETLLLRDSASRLTMIDPNVRPSFIKDEDRYRARINKMMAASDIVKTSDEDLDWLTGSTDATSLLSSKTKVVLLTRGADGVTILTEAGSTDVPAQKVDVVDTVGAGDTFNAGFLAGLSQQNCLSQSALLGADLVSAAELGAKAAAITVSRAGANPPWANEL